MDILLVDKMEVYNSQENMLKVLLLDYQLLGFPHLIMIFSFTVKSLLSCFN